MHFKTACRKDFESSLFKQQVLCLSEIHANYYGLIIIYYTHLLKFHTMVCKYTIAVQIKTQNVFESRKDTKIYKSS